MQRSNGNEELIGNGAAMRELREEVDQVARSDAKVLITGESGVGKELVARAIYRQSARAERPFVTVNCAGIPESLLESELFGHVKGSFTGAYRDKPGKFEQSDEGTIFLDEIGEMTLRMQSLLLRFLETGEIQKVGAHRAIGTVNVRVIAATNRNLRDLIRDGQFREDLFYRLNVIHISVPSLRERKEDVGALVEHFFGAYAGRNGGNGCHLSPEATDLLIEYSWPGNVRELQNVIERLIVRKSGDEIGVDDLPPEVRARRGLGVAPRRERRRTVVDDLYQRLTENRESFWTAVYPLYMQREITRSQLRELVRRGLEQAHGNYKIVSRMFNMEPGDYKRFLNFLRNHECQLPFKHYR